MRNSTPLLSLTLLLLASAGAGAQSAGPFQVQWLTIDGGGGMQSAGGGWRINGTIGQPDAGILAGGSFKLEGGFWSGVTVAQTPGAPLLKINLIAGGFAVLSWPVSVTGFMLEETSTAAQPNSWNATAQPVVDNSTEHTVKVPSAGLIKCYRLRR